jgi:hypothetical protein
MVLFFIIFILQIFFMFLTGLLYKLLYELGYDNFLFLCTFLIACFGPIAFGMVLNYINRKLFHYKLKNIFICILLSLIIITLSFCMCLGLIQIPVPDILDSALLYFWVYLFSGKGDPMRIIGLGVICIPTFIIIAPISFWFFNRTRKSS